MYRMSDMPEFREMSKHLRNRRNRARRRVRKQEWKANNPKPERNTSPSRVPENVSEEHESPSSVSDVLKAVSANRKKVRK